MSMNSKSFNEAMAEVINRKLEESDDLLYKWAEAEVVIEAMASRVADAITSCVNIKKTNESHEARASFIYEGSLLKILAENMDDIPDKEEFETIAADILKIASDEAEYAGKNNSHMDFAKAKMTEVAEFVIGNILSQAVELAKSDNRDDIIGAYPYMGFVLQLLTLLNEWDDDSNEMALFCRIFSALDIQFKECINSQS